MSVDEGGHNCNVAIAVQCTLEDPVAPFVSWSSLRLLPWLAPVTELASSVSANAKLAYSRLALHSWLTGNLRQSLL